MSGRFAVLVAVCALLSAEACKKKSEATSSGNSPPSASSGGEDIPRSSATTTTSTTPEAAAPQPEEPAAPQQAVSRDVLVREPVTEAAQVRHILIGWDETSGKNTDPRAAQRTQAEAGRLAQQLLQKVRDGMDMAALMYDYSEDPGNARTGAVATVAWVADRWVVAWVDDDGGNGILRLGEIFPGETTVASVHDITDAGRPTDPLIRSWAGLAWLSWVDKTDTPNRYRFRLLDDGLGVRAAGGPLGSADADVFWRRDHDVARDPGTGRFQLKRLWSVLFGPESMIPTLQDAKDFIAHQKWFFGTGPRPQFDRWTYWEKFDYFSVFWGVAIIGASGLIMWFPEFFSLFLPGWAINIALIVHSDEALLAAGFIFTFHFFNVHFRIEKFPMDPVIFSGRISRTEMLHERKRWYDRLTSAGQLQEHRVKDEWARWQNIAGAFGYMFFGVGVLLLILIVLAMSSRLVH